jgi:hypothetical protein
LRTGLVQSLGARTPTTRPPSRTSSINASVANRELLGLHVTPVAVPPTGTKS